MRAVIVNEPSESWDNMVIADVPEPKPGKGEVLVSVAYGGCNFADTMMRRGIYPHPKGYPLVAGLEFSGRIAALGPEVSGLKEGDRVVAFSEDAGGFAELCAVPAKRVVVLPDDIGLDAGAAFLIQATTAWHLLHTVGVTKPGDVLLIHAIGGGVGLYLTQLATAAGARVIGTVGTAGKERRALAYGAHRVINREDEDFVAAVLDFTDGRGVDKIVDSTGASILDRSFETIRNLGHVISYGEAEGRPYENLWERLVRRSLTFTRLHLGHLDYNTSIWSDSVHRLCDLIRAGKLDVPIAEIFPLEKAADMYARLESRQVAGKLLLKIGGG